MEAENLFRYAFYKKIPGCGDVHARPAYGTSWGSDSGEDPDETSHKHRDISWKNYWGVDENEEDWDGYLDLNSLGYPDYIAY